MAGFNRSLYDSFASDGSRDHEGPPFESSRTRDHLSDSDTDTVIFSSGSDSDSGPGRTRLHSSRWSIDSQFVSRDDDVNSEDYTQVMDVPYRQVGRFQVRNVCDQCGMARCPSSCRPPPVEPEAGTIDLLRDYGVRFIRRPLTYNACDCIIPRDLIDWITLAELSGEQPLPISIGSTFRWGEIKQDFNVDIFGDLQFQDFLLHREARDPQYALLHFAGTFIIIAWNGSRWGILELTDDLEERWFETKQEFLDNLFIYVKHTFIPAVQQKAKICPFPNFKAHMYVRDDDYSPEEHEEPDIDSNPGFHSSGEYEDNSEYVYVNGAFRPKPNRLSYRSLYERPLVIRDDKPDKRRPPPPKYSYAKLPRKIYR